MIDRLEKMRSRATGNGVTQCFLCSTDFGLLASKSYAAMCFQCRKVSFDLLSASYVYCCCYYRPFHVFMAETIVRLRHNFVSVYSVYLR